MLKIINLFMIAGFMLSAGLYGQNLAEHYGNDRLLIIVLDDVNIPEYALQMAELHKDPIGLEDRKIVVYQTTAQAYQKGLWPDMYWRPSKVLYEQYKRPNTTFEIILVGLDGGVKARRTNVFPIRDLIQVIDDMSIR